MALRAGYYGLKKSLIETIAKLSGAKIVKSIGDGLKLTAAGKLSCDIDTSTMEFKNGKLASKGSSVDYSTNEFDTGRKWIDGSTIYGRTITKAAFASADEFVLTDAIDNIHYLYSEGSYTYIYQNDNVRGSLGSFLNAMANIYYNNSTKKFTFGTSLGGSFARYTDLEVTVYYTKIETT